jgi:hypothetical protein
MIKNDDEEELSGDPSEAHYGEAPDYGDPPEQDSPELIAEDDFLRALMNADAHEAAQALRKIRSMGWRLDRESLDVLADLFEGHCDRLFPWALKFKQTRKGKPVTQAYELARLRTQIRWAVSKELSKTDKFEAAIAAVAESMNLSAATIKKYAGKKSSYKKSTTC